MIHGNWYVFIARNDLLESLFVIRLGNMVNFELLGEEIEKTCFSILSQVQNKEKILNPPLLGLLFLFLFCLMY